MNQCGEQRMDKSKRESMKWFFFPKKNEGINEGVELTLNKVG